jgi:hypothetical protein
MAEELRPGRNNLNIYLKSTKVVGRKLPLREYLHFIETSLSTISLDLKRLT